MFISNQFRNCNICEVRAPEQISETMSTSGPIRKLWAQKKVFCTNQLNFSIVLSHKQKHQIMRDSFGCNIRCYLLFVFMQENTQKFVLDKPQYKYYKAVKFCFDDFWHWMCLSGLPSTLHWTWETWWVSLRFGTKICSPNHHLPHDDVDQSGRAVRSVCDSSTGGWENRCTEHLSWGNTLQVWSWFIYHQKFRDLLDLTLVWC